MCIDLTEVSPGLALKGMLLEIEIKKADREMGPLLFMADDF
jgi:hypothetical protein